MPTATELTNRPILARALRHGWEIVYHQNLARVVLSREDGDTTYRILYQRRLIAETYRETLSSQWGFCRDCHCELDEEAIQLDDDGGDWDYCTDCVSTCEDCDCQVRNNYTTSVDGGNRLVCESCLNDYTTCSSCEETYHDDNFTRHNWSWYCNSCYNDLHRCESCNEIADTDDDNLCEDCAHKPSIHPYSYRPSPVMFGDGKIRLGIELEVQSDLDNADDVADWIEDGYCYCKEDSSLTEGDGFEIVSHPADWDWLNEHKDEWETLLAHLTKRGAKSWNTQTCGMHVHVSRRPLSQLTQYKLQKLMYEHPRFWRKLAGRKSEDYASFSKEDVKLRIRKAKGNNSPARYVACNFPSGGKTIEFRIFKGTLCFDSFWRNLEAVWAAVRFCQQSGLSETTEDGFRNWVLKNQDTFPRLSKWLVEKMPVSA